MFNVCESRVILATFLLSIGSLACAAQDTLSSEALEPVIAEDYLLDLWEMARAEREQKRLLDAIETLRAILEQRPDLDRVRLELAVVSYEALDLEEARRQCDLLLDKPDLSPRVRKAVESFAQKVADKQESYSETHTLKPSVTVGVVYDDNVNVGPASDLIEIDDVLYSVRPQYRPRSDWGSLVRASLKHRYQPAGIFYFRQRPAKLYWDSRALVSSRAYAVEEDYDLDIASLRTGPLVSLSGGHKASVTLRSDYLGYGGEDYARFTSLYGSGTVSVDVAKLSLDLGLVEKDYLQSSSDGRDGEYRYLGLRAERKFLDDKFDVKLGVIVSDEATADRYYNNSGYQLTGGLNYRAGDDLQFGLRYRQRKLDYEGLSTLFGVRRSDDQKQLDLNVTYELPKTRFGTPELEAGLSSIRRRSNIPIYSYDRNQIFVAVRVNF